jgi:hypothetical protein
MIDAAFWGVGLQPAGYQAGQPAGAGGASITVTPNGALVLTAPGGVVVNGSEIAPSQPTDPFAYGEVVAGDGTSWTLENAPCPASSLQLFVEVPGFGSVLVNDYEISGAAITTTNHYGAGLLRAWYRY